jgi:hypothetical protein
MRYIGLNSSKDEVATFITASQSTYDKGETTQFAFTLKVVETARADAMYLKLQTSVGEGLNTSKSSSFNQDAIKTALSEQGFTLATDISDSTVQSVLASALVSSK